MIRVMCVVAIGILLGTSSRAADVASSPDVYTSDPQLMAQSEARVLAGDAALRSALARLRADADAELVGPLVKVTDKPDELAGTVGGKHNYASISRYFWPDEKNPKAPWVMHDGQPNKEAIARFDGPRLQVMTKRVIVCAQAYYFTGEEKYAARAADQLRAWFINPETRMNPNLDYSQCVPNKNSGNPWGIIDVNQFPYLLDGVTLLQGSGQWSRLDQEGLQAWFAQFTDWLYNSKLGRGERAARNNHGTFYDLLLARSAIFCGNDKITREVIHGFGPTRIARQIQPDGSTPEEQKRVDSAMYTCWNLKGMADMLLLARRFDVDLWKYEGEQGQSLRKAALWLMPYVEDPTRWKYGDGKFSEGSPAEFFWIISATTQDSEITAFCRKHFRAPASGGNAGKEKWRSNRLMLLFPIDQSAPEN